MEKKNKIIALIPARSGSKRLKGKNKKIFCGKPLFCWSVDLALRISEIDKVIISTDDEDILLYCYEHYNDFDNFYIRERPKELAQDDTPTWKVIEDLHNHKIIEKNSRIVLLQPTSPIRYEHDIIIPISICKSYASGVVSVYKKDEKTYIRNGAIYVGYYDKWIKDGTVDGIYYLMPKSRSVDIDTLEDFQLAEKIMKNERN